MKLKSVNMPLDFKHRTGKCGRFVKLIMYRKAHGIPSSANSVSHSKEHAFPRLPITFHSSRHEMQITHHEGKNIVR